MTLLVFGMDGAVREYVEKAIERGLMPNTEKLIEEGAFGDMKSCTPPVTIPAWVSMFSGLDPDKFDTYQMTELQEGEIKSVSRDRWKGRMLWDRLDGSFGLINVPGTSPPWRVKGYVYEGFPMVTDPSVLPEELEEELHERFGFDFEEPGSKSTRERRRNAYHRNFEKRREIFDAIDREVDVRIEVYQLTDTAAHRSATLDKVLEAYEKVDKALGSRMEEYDDVLLVSDHGFTQVDSYFYINTWLQENGYLMEEGKEETGLDWRQRLQELLTPLAESRLRPYLKKLNDLMSSKADVDLAPKGKGPESIDFSSSRAYSYRGGSTNYADINVNSEVVDDREAIVQELASRLSSIEEVEEVWEAEEIYAEPGQMPELVVKTRDDVGIGMALFPKVFLGTDAFIHSDTGIVGAIGPSFRSGGIEGAEIVDVATTVARYLGQELEGTDGEPLDIFREGFEPVEVEETEELESVDV